MPTPKSRLCITFPFALSPIGGGSLLSAQLALPRAKLPRFREGYFGTSGLPGQYFDLVKIQLLASASVSKSPI
jgi:hypothetical protein